MDIPEPFDPKPEEQNSYSRWAPTISNDSDWNKMNSRRNPNRAIVLKGQKSQKVIHTARQLMQKDETEIRDHINNFNGNNWGFSDTQQAISFIVELHEAGTQYFICMSNDGRPSGSWSHSRSPYRAYNRSPNSEETEWYYNSWQSRTPVEKMWQNRAHLAVELTDLDWYNIQEMAEAKSAALRTASDTQTMNRANERMAEETQRLAQRIIALGAINRSDSGAQVLFDSLHSIWKNSSSDFTNADELHQATYEATWNDYETLLSELGFEA
jgi:hypothetical protein